MVLNDDGPSAASGGGTGRSPLAPLCPTLSGPHQARVRPLPTSRLIQAGPDAAGSGQPASLGLSSGRAGGGARLWRVRGRGDRHRREGPKQRLWVGVARGVSETGRKAGAVPPGALPALFLAVWPGSVGHVKAPPPLHADRPCTPPRVRRHPRRCRDTRGRLACVGRGGGGGGVSQEVSTPSGGGPPPAPVVGRQST